MATEEEKEALKRFEHAIASREASVQTEKRRRKISRRPFNLEKERNFAAIAGMPLADAMAILRLAQKGLESEK